MKFEDLQKITELEVCEYTGNTLHLHCKEGYFLTDFKEGDDYLLYNDFFCSFLVIQEEYPNYQVITKLQHDENLEKRTQAIKDKQARIIEEEENKRIEEMLKNNVDTE